MAQLIIINKPVNVLCQFSDKQGRKTLADVLPKDKFPDVYPAGRLDYDSEGLVALTNDGALQHQISHPQRKLSKTYWVQLEGIVDEGALAMLQQGVELKDGKTRAAKVSRLEPPKIWERNPPIRHRVNIPTSWIELCITEGRNRQVRRMTAAVGYPTLRLIRTSIGPWHIGDMAPGDYRVEQVNLPRQTNHRPAQRRRDRHRRI